MRTKTGNDALHAGTLIKTNAFISGSDGCTQLVLLLVLFFEK
ncbi:MAG: hypothetical protein V2B19_00095 [Pseudomonadota bacterium]